MIWSLHNLIWTKWRWQTYTATPSLLSKMLTANCVSNANEVINGLETIDYISNNVQSTFAATKHFSLKRWHIVHQNRAYTTVHSVLHLKTFSLKSRHILHQNRTRTTVQRPQSPKRRTSPVGVLQVIKVGHLVDVVHFKFQQMSILHPAIVTKLSNPKAKEKNLWSIQHCIIN